MILQMLCDRQPLGIAHRGARSVAPENTLEAARKAFAVGTQIWELDVSATRDGELVVIHDDTLERTSNVADVFPQRRPWRVADFTLEELRVLDFGSWFIRSDPFGQVANGTVSTDECLQFVGLRIPTLAEALWFTRQANRAVNIEIKDQRGTRQHAIIATRVLDLIEEMEMIPQVIVSSFHHPYLEQVRLRCRSVLCGVLTSRFMRTPERTLSQLGHALFHPKVDAVTPDQIRFLRHEGFHVLVWVANDRATMQKLLADGASGLFTDFPKMFLDLLRESTAVQTG